MKKTNKRPGIFKSIALRTVAIALSLWFFAMGLITWATAVDMKNSVVDLLRESDDWLVDRENSWNNDENLHIPGEVEANAITNASEGYYLLNPYQFLPIVAHTNGVGSKDWLWGKWNLFFGIEPAAVFFDEEGKTIAKTGSYLMFYYADSSTAKEPQGVAYIDLEPILASVDRNKYSETFQGYPNGFGVFWYGRLAIEGYFRGNELIPQNIDGKFSSLDTWWTNIYTAENIEDEPMVTVYGWNPRSFVKEQVPVTVEGETFSTLEDLLESRIGLEDPYIWDDSFFDTILIKYYPSLTDSYGNYGAIFGVRIKPVEYALLRLLPFILITLALTAIGICWYLRWLKKHIKEPLEAVKRAEAVGVDYQPSARLQEICEIEQRYSDSYRAFAQSEAERNRLQKALEYSQNAEENRRQWLSNITHELKTPLAVIHSHAECLLEDIVPEKREQYLSVILEETRNLDDMVLQMLDISRLEAGKARLNLDSFSLIAMTQKVLDRFAVLIEEKSLNIKWKKAPDFLITADEQRMEQAVTNLISNAVKYTIAHGTITLSVSVKEHQISFSISNTAQPLTPEELEMVWESFYRVDPSRTEPGTGLGLSLVKNIIELHGGKCYAQNVFMQYPDTFYTGVEFGFTIPIK